MRRPGTEGVNVTDSVHVAPLARVTRQFDVPVPTAKSRLGTPEVNTSTEFTVAATCAVTVTL